MRFTASFFGLTAKNKDTTPLIMEEPQKHIVGYDLHCKKQPTKRALLSYLVQPCLDELAGIKTVRFSNDGLALSWAKVLNELGYIVDIINWDDCSFMVEKDYGLFVYHGGVNFEHLSQFKENLKKAVYFSSGSYWKFHNQQEDKRLVDFNNRHGVMAPRDRYIDFPEEEANLFANAIVALGDTSMADTYPFQNVITINNCSYPDNHFDKYSKDYEATRHNFLYFAGSGNIHKGLDLLVDSFKTLEQHLYIVGRLDDVVLQVFEKELKLPNIHVIGEVNMRTKEFYDVMDTCAFTILPSCSEGQAGSVVECMNQGLSPIVSKETRLDTKNFGFILKDSSTSEICAVVKRLAALPAEKVSELSKLTRANTLKEHSPSYFDAKLTKILQDIEQA